MKNNYEVKQRIGFKEQEQYTRMVADSYFEEDALGEISYTPWNAEKALYVGFLYFFVDGAIQELTEESIDLAMENDDLYKLFLIHEHDSIINKVENQARMSADFKKQQILSSTSLINVRLAELADEQMKMVKLQEELLKKQKKIADMEINKAKYDQKIMELMTPEQVKEFSEYAIKNNFTPEEFGEAIVGTILESDEHYKKVQSIVEDKNKQIVELSKYKKANDLQNTLQ